MSVSENLHTQYYYVANTAAAAAVTVALLYYKVVGIVALAENRTHSIRI